MASYLVEANAQAIFDERLNTDAWDNASSADRVKALAMATQIIDRLNILGEKAVSTQELQFPRKADTLVPNDIERACTEIALALLDGVDPDLEHQTLRIVSQTYANIKSTHNTQAFPAYILAGVPSFRAWTYLKPYLRDPGGIKVVRES